MFDKDVIRTIRTLRKYGFPLGLDPAIANSDASAKQLYAAQAAASLLYNVDIAAFDAGGNWEGVKQYVLKNGLRTMTEHEGMQLGLDAIRVATVNVALKTALGILELAQAT